MEKRSVDVVVLSDVHLGTYGCRARELVNYLKSITPGILILNGRYHRRLAIQQELFSSTAHQCHS